MIESCNNLSTRPEKVLHLRSSPSQKHFIFIVSLSHSVPKRRKEQETAKKKATNQNNESELHHPKEHNATNLETNQPPQPSPNLPPEHSILLPQTYKEKKEREKHEWGRRAPCRRRGKSKPWTIPFLSDDPFEWKKGIQLILHHEFLKNVKGFHWWEQDVGMDDVLFWWLIDQFHSLEDDVEFAVLHSLFEEWFAELCCLLRVCESAGFMRALFQSIEYNIPILMVSRLKGWRKRHRTGWAHVILVDPVDGCAGGTRDCLQYAERFDLHSLYGNFLCILRTCVRVSEWVSVRVWCISE